MKTAGVASEAGLALPDDAISSPARRQVAAVDDLMLGKVHTDGTVSQRWARLSDDLTKLSDSGVEAVEDGRPLARNFYASSAARPLDQTVERTLSFRLVSAGSAKLWQLGSSDATAERPVAPNENAELASGKTYALSLPAVADGGTLSADAKASPGAADAVGTSPAWSTGPREQWTVLDAGAGWVRLVNKADGLCLADGSGQGQRATTRPCQGAAAAAAETLWQLGKQDTSGFGGFNGYRLFNKRSGLAAGPGAVQSSFGKDPDPTKTWQLTEIHETGGVVPTWTVPAGADVAAGAGLATGDLDDAIDADTQYHDEAAVAFVEDDHQVQVRVLDYADDTLRETGLTLDVQAGGQAQGAWRTGSLNVAVGDFAGDGGNEIAVTRQDAKGQVFADILRYADGNDRSLTIVAAAQKVVGIDPNGDVSPSLVTGMVDTTAGDFDGNGRDELAVVYGAGANPSQLHPRLNVAAFQAGAAKLDGAPAEYEIPHSSADFLPTPNLSTEPWISRGPEAEAGLFKFDPDADFGQFRRQIAVAWSTRTTLNKDADVFKGETGLITVKVDRQGGVLLPSLLGAQIHSDLLYDKVASPQMHRFPLSLSVGGLGGLSDDKEPSLDGVAYADVGLPSDYDNANPNYSSKLTILDSSFRATFRETSAAGRLDVPWSYRPVAYDRTGRSIHLGAPLVMTLTNLNKPSVIAAQPPAHADWLSGRFVNVSRDPDFAVSMTSSEGVETTTTSTTKTSSTFGVSEATDIKDTLTLGLEKEDSASASAEVKQKLNKEYESEQSAFTSNTSSRKTTTSATGSDDDLVDAFITTHRLFRYPILGAAVVTKDGKTDPSRRSVYEVVVNGTPTEVLGGGKAFSWYQPTWQNGNALSYPQLDGNGKVVVDDPGTHTTGSGTAATSSTDPLISTNHLLGGTRASIELDIDGTRKASNEWASSSSLANSQEVGVGVKSVASFPLAVKNKFEAEATMGFDEKSAESTLSTYDATTTQGSGFVLEVPEIDASKGYQVGTTYYNDAAGAAKVRHGVNLLGNNQGQQWWKSSYNKQDLALNLPLASVMTKSPAFDTDTEVKWTDLPSRQQIRGFYALQPQDPAKPATSGVPYVDNPRTGDPVTFAVQVHNYSLQPSAEATASFYAVRVDENGLEVQGAPLPIGSTRVPGLAAQGMTTVSSPSWTAEGPEDGSGLQNWRIFTVVDTGGKDEVHPLRGGAPCPEESIDGSGGSDGGLTDPMTGKPETLACGQNNQGYGEITVDGSTLQSTATPARADLDGASLTSEDALDAPRGVPRVVLGEQVHGIVHASSDTTTGQAHQVLVYDGNPDKGGELIAATTMAGVDAQLGGHTDFTWRPTKAGRHTLYQKLLRTDGTVDQQKFVIKVVDHGDPERLVVKADTSTPAAGKATAVSAATVDEYGNEVDDVTKRATFSISPDGSCAAAKCKATRAGEHTINVTYRSMSGTTTVDVRPGAAKTLRMSPSKTSVDKGQKVTYRIDAYDRYGNLRGDVAMKTKLAVKPDGRCRAATCTATKAGKHTVTAKYHKLKAKATLTVRR